MSEIKTVKMKRNEPQFPGGPLTADVHPDEVENWKPHGWELAVSEKAPESKKEADDASPLADSKPKPKKRGRKLKSASS